MSFGESFLTVLPLLTKVLGIHAIFGNAQKAKTLLIIRLQDFMHFDSLWGDPSEITYIF